MPKPADTSTKKLISLAPDNWVRWVTDIPDIKALEILSSEFQWISRESDVLIRATSPENGEFLVLNELQLRYNSKMPRRMRCYAALAEEKYQLPTYPVLINILPTNDVEIPRKFTSNVSGLTATQDYRVINLWEVDASIPFQQSLPSLLPFVPILKGGGNESTIREALQILRRDDDLNQLETVLAFFATFVLESALIKEIMRWDMTVLRESPWYQEILKEGEIKGEARGEVQGIISSIRTSLEAKFGNEALELMPQISQINDLSQLQGILRTVVLANSLEELRQSFL
ncbi:Rpn family recombination-promoting nuclease/putative transposase (plasmid) [Okeanomitos corallinicola TIOX110]|uniref:Rpn family recombination-promoting nuclease/putative transposase n=1 Tax=Okeanomitos corallinicola TIOX110 TaxID=3133117 RepID=A0ABZ2UZ80_9CYAN